MRYVLLLGGMMNLILVVSDPFPGRAESSTETAGQEMPAEMEEIPGKSQSKPGLSKRLPGEHPPLTEEEIGDIERSNFLPIRDRWRIGYHDSWWDPYNQ